MEIDWCIYSYVQGGLATVGTYITEQTFLLCFLLKSFTEVHFCFTFIWFFHPTSPKLTLQEILQLFLSPEKVQCARSKQDGCKV